MVAPPDHDHTIGTSAHGRAASTITGANADPLSPAPSSAQPDTDHQRVRDDVPADAHSIAMPAALIGAAFFAISLATNFCR